MEDRGCVGGLRTDLSTLEPVGTLRDSLRLDGGVNIVNIAGRDWRVPLCLS